MFRTAFGRNMFGTRSFGIRSEHASDPWNVVRGDLSQGHAAIFDINLAVGISHCLAYGAAFEETFFLEQRFFLNVFLLTC